jgi:mono/diheme cytochrome c family protein
MKQRCVTLAAGFGLAICSLMGQSARSIRDGVYSVEQAKRGRAAYSERCFECHGRDLTGDVETRPLVGYEFTTNWADGSLLRLFDRVRVTMPADKPGTLNRQTVADILAFVLQTNGYPAGNEDLSTRSEILEQIKFEVPK